MKKPEVFFSILNVATESGCTIFTSGITGHLKTAGENYFQFAATDLQTCTAIIEHYQTRLSVSLKGLRGEIF